MTIADALREGRSRLALSGTDTPGLDVEVLIRHALGIDRTRLFSSLRERIEPQLLATFRELISSRAAGTPVAYLIGQREFMGLTFTVGPGVLIPRPETEILVEWAIRWLRGRNSATVVDVGTGSGAVALGVAFAMKPDWPGRIVATDVSLDALKVASSNRDRLGLHHLVELRQESLLAGFNEPVDLVLANLPYLRPEQIAGNPELSAEPRLALEGGLDGLDLIRALLKDSPRVVAPGGAIGLEFDPDQRKTVVELGRSAFPGSDIAILQDLAGHDRHIVIQTTP